MRAAPGPTDNLTYWELLLPCLRRLSAILLLKLIKNHMTLLPLYFGTHANQTKEHQFLTRSTIQPRSIITVYKQAQKIMASNQGPGMLTAVNWATRNIRMVHMRAPEIWETKLENCEVSAKKIWLCAKPST
jgi:hypothetical protein